ncbi:hypothetical protein D3H65_14395 [Paraflavitalea soli]|uniref:RagB/SusD family nutrient uptake outer membrane protein n=1 Tax=Paraflavitalea soli TaxID=2315862 RepID=A0A3B7MQ33_9BACT|nr:hypothetical protein [Paraflavitalea soli]AXY75096.1 hypothetical protein D3H65_14395 [Paraflavitalea soli]
MKKIIYIALSVSLLGACKKISFDDPSSFTNEEANTLIRDLGYKLVTSSIQNTFNTTTSAAGTHFSLLADQTTNTNGNSSWWDFANEPRLRLNNNASYRGATTWNTFYNNFYQANLDATIALDIIEVQKKNILDNLGNDRTKDCQVAAYFSKGVAQGYLGVIFDKGIIVDEANLSTRAFPNSYKELIANGLKLIDKSIQLAEESPNLKFDFLTGVTITRTTFIQLANSLAARILSSQPRDKVEAAALGDAHWNKVLAYAAKGVTADYTIATVTGGYYNQLVSNLVQRNTDGSGWLAPDLKIAYLADKTGNTPPFYPSSGVLPPITSDDQRFAEYFGYTPSFGIMLESRGRGLFTNYYRIRWYNTRNTLNTPGAINPYFLLEEIRLLKAESKYWLKDYTGAASELNAATASRIAKGKLPPVAATEADLKKTLHYEYAIEIDDAGGAFIPFTFMRRNNLLIGGTPTQYPLPQLQLELTKNNVYTYGGKAFFGEKGSYGEVATAPNEGWKASE